MEYDNGSFALGKSLSFIPEELLFDAPEDLDNDLDLDEDYECGIPMEEFVEFLKSVPDGTKGFRSYPGSDKFLHIASIDDTNFGNLYIELHL